VSFCLRTYISQEYLLEMMFNVLRMCAQVNQFYPNAAINVGSSDLKETELDLHSI
jgi:hypothetical protein